jgi:hypothetical protein
MAMPIDDGIVVRKGPANLRNAKTRREVSCRGGTLRSHWIGTKIEPARSQKLYTLDTDELLDCRHTRLHCTRGTGRAESFVGPLVDLKR